MASLSIVAPGLTSDLGDFASLALSAIPVLTLFLIKSRVSSLLKPFISASSFALLISALWEGFISRLIGNPYWFNFTPTAGLADSSSVCLSVGLVTFLSPSGGIALALVSGSIFPSEYPLTHTLFPEVVFVTLSSPILVAN